MKKKLLVVDDDEILRKLIKLELSDTYEIIDTGEPEQGLALALEHRPSAVLLDLRMPKYSGYELCQTLTSFSRTQAIPVLIVSGEAGAETKEHCRQLGATGYFEKPVDFALLRARLEELGGASQHTPRSEVRVRLRVTLRLRGKDASGNGFEDFAVTENVSVQGFLCGCRTNLPIETIVEVFLARDRSEYVGKAEIVYCDQSLAPLYQYGCRFIEKSGAWILR